MAQKKKKRTGTGPPARSAGSAGTVASPRPAAPLELTEEQRQAAAGRALPSARQLAKTARLTGSAAALIEPLPDDKAGVPLDRVPYVTGDLLRVGIMAVLMLILVIAGGLVASRFTAGITG